MKSETLLKETQSQNRENAVYALKNLLLNNNCTDNANIYTNVAKYVVKVSNGYDHDPDLIVVSILRVVQSLK